MEDELMHDLVAGYALDALDDDERIAFEAHLATCEACRDELEALAVPTLALAFGAPPAAPPGGLRDRVLAAARTERRTVVPLRPRWAYPALAGAVAASVAAVGLGIWAAVEHDRAGSAQQALESVPLQGASGAVVLTSGRRGELVVSGLPALPSGKTYELWVLHGTAAAPAGLFSPRTGATTIVPIQRSVPRGTRLGITVEPAGGSPQPSGRPLVVSATA